MTRQFWWIEGKTEGSESLPYGREIHQIAKMSSGEPFHREGSKETPTPTLPRKRGREQIMLWM